jgi:hypothetical protein
MSLPNIAQNLASKGRYGDSMLMHVSPGEVQGLQALAQAHGTSLSINPSTGMPEAFSLKRLLPTIAGIGLSMIPGVGPLMAAGIVGAGTALSTGSLQKGLVAGLGAYGGASLAGSAANLATPAAQAATAGGANTAAAGATGAFDAGLGLDAMAGGAGTVATPASAVIAPAETLSLSGSAGDFTGLANPAGAPVDIGFGPGAYSPSYNAADIAGMSAQDFGAMAQQGGFASPNQVTLANLKSGLGNITSSPEAFGSYLGDNKMNLATAFSPLLVTEPPKYDLPASGPQMIRPFDLAIDNVSGQTPYSPGGAEQQQLTYTFTPREPYEASEAYKRRQPFSAAQGGVVAFQEGGMAETASAPAETDAPQMSPSMARTLQNISMVQGLAGLPRINTQGLPSPTSTLNPVVDFAPRTIPSSIERAVNLPVIPRADTSPTYIDQRIKSAIEAERERQAAEAAAEAARQAQFNSMYGGGAAGGMMPGDLKPIRRNMGGSLGLAALAKGGTPAGRFLNGPGDGVSDSIPAVIGNKQPARLADGEFVIDARTVSEIGNGSSKAGAKKLYAMMDRVHKARKKAGRGKDSKADRFLPA